jgi:cephalosporin hydroxylase
MKNKIEFQSTSNGGGIYKGNCGSSTMYQAPKIIGCFEKFFKDKNFDTIIEIGTAFGGLTMLLVDLNPFAEIHTFDTVEWITDRIDGATKNIGNVFFEEKENIVRMILEEKKVLLICDGGDKPREFNVFSPYLKSGDFIIAHDYEENTCDWGWIEIRKNDIEDVVKEFNLLPHMSDVMGEVAWACFEKS